MLAQRRRRWANIVQMLYKCFVFTGMEGTLCYRISALSLWSTMEGTQKTQDVAHVLVQCWAAVCNADPTYKHHRCKVMRLVNALLLFPFFCFYYCVSILSSHYLWLITENYNDNASQRHPGKITIISLAHIHHPSATCRWITHKNYYSTCILTYLCEERAEIIVDTLVSTLTRRGRN